MKQSIQSKVMLMFAGGALVLAGYFMGANQHSPVAHAQPVANKNASVSGVMGVSIPNGGAALVKAKDGMAYVVQSSGLYIRAVKAGKTLELD